MVALLLAVCVAAGPSPARAAPPAAAAAEPAGRAGAAEPLDRRRDAIADELVKLGGRLQREIEAGDVEAILARVPAAGLRCADRVVPRARVARELRDPASWLHGTLFGPPGRPAPGPPRSLRGFFAAAREVAVLISFRRDTRAGPVGLPCLEYRARDLAAPRVPLCFEARDGRWWLAESLYPCG